MTAGYFHVLESDQETIAVITCDLDYALQQPACTGRVITQGEEELYFADDGCWWMWEREENDDG